MRKKRIVFIVDEAHRSTFGDMLITIKQTFGNALFFGFTGTPIHDENQREMNTTATVFGDELHRYSIADGIRDKNVLGFDPYKVMTYKDTDLRKAVALERAHASNEAEALADSQKKEVFNRYMRKVGMAGHLDAAGQYVKGIEAVSYTHLDVYKRQLPTVLIQTLTTLTQALADKYATTYADVANEIVNTEGELACMIDELTGNPFDMQGLAEFKAFLKAE